MKRRTMIAATLAAPLVSAARQAAAAERLVGWISPETPEAMAPFTGALKAGLAAAAPSGQQIRIIERHVGGRLDTIAAQIAELQQLGVAVIVSQGAATPPVVQAKPSVPVVFGYSGDPVVAGIAQSLARPGGNATGVTFMAIELNVKRIDLVRTVLPDCRKVALLSNARHPGEEKEIDACQSAVERLGVELAIYRVQAAAEAKAALERAIDGGAQAVVVLPSGGMVQQAPALAAVCLARKVPLISGWAAMARAGALLTYGPNLQEAYKRVAYYVVRILNGATPGNLPIEQPTVFELVINMKTAAALGLTLSPSLLVQANELIE
jgi:putative ABC transport system substrate-binding protein